MIIDVLAWICLLVIGVIVIFMLREVAKCLDELMLNDETDESDLE